MLLKLNLCVYRRLSIHTILKQKFVRRQNGSEAGMKVKIDMRFRGRLITRLEVGRKIMNDFIEAMDEVAIVEKKPSMEGNTMSTVLAPKKK